MLTVAIATILMNTILHLLSILYKYIQVLSSCWLPHHHLCGIFPSFQTYHDKIEEFYLSSN